MVCNWDSTYFGAQTLCHILHNKPGEISKVILKHIPLNIAECHLLNDIKELYPSCTEIKRFIKNGSPLHTCLASFSSKSDHEKALVEGVMLGDLFFKPFDYVPKKLPTRCFNCNKFGHPKSLCRATKPVCVNCSENHSSDLCESTVKKCCNCGGSHAASDKSCPSFKEIFNELNFL